MPDDERRPDGDPAPTFHGPQMYSFDGRPVDPPMPSKRSASAPRAIWPRRVADHDPDAGRDAGAGRDPDAPSEQDAPTIAQGMPSARWPLSVVAVLVSLLFGAVAVYFSFQVGARWRRGDVAGAHKASQLAAVWSMVAMAVGLVSILVVGGAA